MALLTHFSLKCCYIPDPSSRENFSTKKPSLYCPSPFHKPLIVDSVATFPPNLSRFIIQRSKMNITCNANTTSKLSPLSNSSDEGCWWLMAGFTQPDGLASTELSQTSTLSNSNVFSNSENVVNQTTASNSKPVFDSIHPNLKSQIEIKYSNESSQSNASDSDSESNSSQLKFKSMAENNRCAENDSSQSNFSESDSDSDGMKKDAFSNGSLQDNSQITLPKPLSVVNVHHSIIEGSRLRVAYQGVPGAYSEAAACKAYPSCEPVPCEQFDAAFQAVELWLVDRAVLPIENSLGGSIHRNYDLLLRHKLHIVGEVQLPIHHCLMALPESNLEDIRRVLSHPQALAQCEMSLQKLGVKREAVLDTAGAAQTISLEKLSDAAAVASARAAKIYGLKILADGIQDDTDNITRFLVLAREPIMPKKDRPFKTSIVFSLEEGSGVLFKALSVFALRDINLTKIESRPRLNLPVWLQATETRIKSSKEENSYHLFDYLFYVDFEASMAETKAQNALRHLQEFATFLRVLGSYPMDVTV